MNETNEEEININNLFLKKKLNELAGMIKERKKGNMKLLIKIKARFCIQEGVNPRTANSYLKILESAGLVTIFDGDKSWKYNPNEEWDLLTVTPSNFRRRRR